MRREPQARAVGHDLGRGGELERPDQQQLDDAPGEADPAGHGEDREGQPAIEPERAIAGRVRQGDAARASRSRPGRRGSRCRRPVARLGRDARACRRPATTAGRSRRRSAAPSGGHRPTPAERPAMHRHRPATSRVDLGLEHPDVAQVAVQLAVVEPVADDELVGDREPDVVDRDLDQPPGGLVEQGADPQRRRAPCRAGSGSGS